MKQTIYNINCKFSFNNVSSELTKFWLNEIIELNPSKIWLTIVVYNKKNKSYTLINNLPFNTLDYTDIIIVLKQVFEGSNRKDSLNKIMFKFNKDYKYNLKNCNLTWYILMYLIYIITIILLFIILIFYLEASQFSYDLVNYEIYSISNNNLESTVCSETFNNVCTKQCIFDPFIKIFNSTSYSPSYFLPVEFKVNVKDYSLLEHIYTKQFAILDKNSKLFYEYVNNTESLKCDINAIVTEYISTNNK